MRESERERRKELRDYVSAGTPKIRRDGGVLFG